MGKTGLFILAVLHQVFLINEFIQIIEDAKNKNSKPLKVGSCIIISHTREMVHQIKQ